MAATFTAAVLAGTGISYEQYVGLYLNIGRAQTRQAYGVLSAFSAALKDSINAQWFTAITESEDEGQAQFNLFRETSGGREQEHWDKLGGA
jgi:hypothetical protein